jgi:hypothetical protein
LSSSLPCPAPDERSRTDLNSRRLRCVSASYCGVGGGRPLPISAHSQRVFVDKSPFRLRFIVVSAILTRSARRVGYLHYSATVSREDYRRWCVFMELREKHPADNDILAQPPAAPHPVSILPGTFTCTQISPKTDNQEGLRGEAPKVQPRLCAQEAARTGL